MKPGGKPQCTALTIGTIACLLATRSAGASLYMRASPPAELTSIRLSPTAGPVGGTNRTGQFHALVIDEQFRDGYRIVKSGLSATQLGGEITLDLESANLYGTRRLDGTVRRGTLSLGVQATDGTIHRLTFTEVSEDQWNLKVARFKEEARLFRLRYEFRWWWSEEQQASARLAENERQLSEAKARRTQANQVLQRATAAYESGKRRLAAAEKVEEAADELSAACDECNSVSAIRSAEGRVREAQQAIRDVAADIDEDERTALERLATAQRDLEQETRSIQGESAGSDSNSGARLAASTVRLAVSGVRLAISGVRLALSGLEREESGANRDANTAADYVMELQTAIDKDTQRIREAKEQQAGINRTGTALAKKLGLDRKRR